MTRKTERPVTLITIVLAMGVCAMAIVGVAMVEAAVVSLPNYLQMARLKLLDVPLWLPLLQVILGAGAGACLLWLLAEFVLMCARVRKETAFTAANVKSLGHIALAFFIGGVLLVVAGNPLMSWLLTGMRGVSSPVWGLLPSFAAWTAALLVRAIQVLMKRAVEMQTESDLTV